MPKTELRSKAMTESMVCHPKRCSRRRIRIAALMAMTSAVLVTTTSSAGAQSDTADCPADVAPEASTCSYLRIDKVPILTAQLANSNCGFQDASGAELERTETPPLEASAGDAVTFCYFVFNDNSFPGSGAPATEVVLVDDNGTPGDTSDDETIELGTIEPVNTRLAQFDTVYNGGDITNTVVATASNNFSDTDHLNQDTAVVRGAAVVQQTTTTIAPAPTTTVAPAPTTTVAPAPTTTIAPAPTTTTTLLALGNNSQLAFTGADDWFTSIWAMALIASGFALLVVSRRRHLR